MKENLRKQKRLGVVAIGTGILSIFVIKEATIVLFLIWLGLVLILEREVCIW